MSAVAGAALVVAALTLTVWRGPQYLVAPNFWAEDGTLFFAGAWHGGLLHGLVQRPAGYLLLYPNLVTSLAVGLVRSDLISLAAAPRVTAAAALLAQLLPIALLAFAAAPAWGGIVRRAAAIAAVLFGTRTGGIWLNTVNSQFFLTLAVIVVLLEPAIVGRTRERIHATVVAVAGLTGPVASFVTLLFLWKAWRARSRSTILVAATSAACAAVQLVCIWQGHLLSAPERTQHFSLAVAGTVALMRTVVLPVLGPDAALVFARGVQPLPGIVGLPFVPSSMFAVLMLVALASIVVGLAWGVPREVRWWLVGSYALVTAGTMAGALGDLRVMLGGVEASARYAFVPGVLVLWLLVLNVRHVRSAPSLVCAALLAHGLGMGALHWRETLRWRASWAQWPEQVEAWQRDPFTPLRIWPRGWAIRLAPRTRVGI